MHSNIYPDPEQWFSADEAFNRLYPENIRALSRKHWTPLLVAEKAADFLAAEKGAKVLDIGSGVGKFCLAAAYYHPNARFTGIEQRESLIGYAEKAKATLGLKNVEFLQGNFTELDFSDYDHFYFYNAFYENISGTEKIDHAVDFSDELYSYYNRKLFRQLEKTRAGTRLATYHSIENEVPEAFHEVGSDINNLLKYWIKL